MRGAGFSLNCILKDTHRDIPTEDIHTDDLHTDDLHTEDIHTDDIHADDIHTDDSPKEKPTIIEITAVK